MMRKMRYLFTDDWWRQCNLFKSRQALPTVWGFSKVFSELGAEKAKEVSQYDRRSDFPEPVYRKPTPLAEC